MKVDVQNVSIKYMTGNFKDIGLKDYVMQRIKGTYQAKEFLAIKDCSFTLEKGDFLGIVGVNGSGKSTLLKAVSGVMGPSAGKIVTQGKIAAFLELSAGFDGEMTVKENAYLRCALLGYTRDFVEANYPDIIAFAELEEFADRPLKQLSSGMKSRLAFSIASLVKPEILILDEVLSVGDGAFRKKSEAKMFEIIENGAITLFVSHSTTQMRKMCNKILWLNKGQQMAFGSAEQILDEYEAFLEKK